MNTPSHFTHPAFLIKFKNIIALIFFIAVLTSCKKQNPIRGEISNETKEKIAALGFSTKNIEADEDGWIVEGDIFLSAADLDRSPQTFFLRIAQNEQYRTFDIVIALPRTFSISLSTSLPTAYGVALDEAIRRYNDENLQVRFQRVSGGADIMIGKGNGNYTANSGFPSSNGRPCSQIKINPLFVGQGNSSESFKNYLATVLAHEIGHCIGFRHTDYMDRSYSCGSKAVNEGMGTAGAVLIPGTPSGPDQISWMIACLAYGQNRPFNANDRVALNYLY